MLWAVYLTASNCVCAFINDLIRNGERRLHQRKNERKKSEDLEAQYVVQHFDPSFVHSFIYSLCCSRVQCGRLKQPQARNITQKVYYLEYKIHVVFFSSLLFHVFLIIGPGCKCQKLFGPLYSKSQSYTSCP